jgi:hypothetical protein
VLLRETCLANKNKMQSITNQDKEIQEGDYRSIKEAKSQRRKQSQIMGKTNFNGIPRRCSLL